MLLQLPLAALAGCLVAGSPIPSKLMARDGIVDPDWSDDIITSYPYEAPWKNVIAMPGIDVFSVFPQPYLNLPGFLKAWKDSAPSVRAPFDNPPGPGLEKREEAVTNVDATAESHDTIRYRQVVRQMTATILANPQLAQDLTSHPLFQQKQADFAAADHQSRGQLMLEALQDPEITALMQDMYVKASAMMKKTPIAERRLARRGFVNWMLGQPDDAVYDLDPNGGIDWTDPNVYPPSSCGPGSPEDCFATTFYTYFMSYSTTYDIGPEILFPAGPFGEPF